MGDVTEAHRAGKAAGHSARDAEVAGLRAENERLRKKDEERGDCNECGWPLEEAATAIEAGAYKGAGDVAAD
jgi:hypothetical protein